MSSFEILCVTMNQTDFSKIKEMNINSNVVFANQSDCTKFEEVDNNGHYAKMITTNTRGVGKNRNLGLIYASADICLFADDDVEYVDDMERIVLSEFEVHPDADIIIFHFNSNNTTRPQMKYSKTTKCNRLSRMPWAGFRIAFRLSSIKKANIWFSTLYGGGCVFPSGEDSMWLNDAKKRGLKIYKSSKTIGKVSFNKSTWFTGYNEKFFYAKGAYYQAVHKKTIYLWMVYFIFRTRKLTNMSFSNKCKCMQNGRKGYKNVKSYEAFKKEKKISKSFGYKQ